MSGMKVQTTHGKLFTLQQTVGSGGEAKIWRVAEDPKVAAKLYHRPSVEREHKLQAMLRNPPHQPKTHLAIAWPTELLYRQGRFVGFLMPNVAGNEPLVNVYNPLRRKQRQPNFTWRHLHRTAFNLAVAVEGIHGRGHVIGDVNESNILVHPHALVTLVDTDSFQILGEQGALYRCLVGKPEYTPPELQGVNFHQCVRRAEHDHFGLAVLLFQLLMEGFHPFAGVLRTPDPALSRIDLHCIKMGIFPYANPRAAGPPPAAPPFSLLHPALQQLFCTCFVDGHRNPACRPTMRQWQETLEQCETALIVCAANPNHVYSDHLAECPWCRRAGGQPIALAVQRPLLPTPTPAVLVTPSISQTKTAGPVASTMQPAPLRAHSRLTHLRARYATLRRAVKLSRLSDLFRRWQHLRRTLRQHLARLTVEWRRIVQRARSFYRAAQTASQRPLVWRMLLVAGLAATKLGLQYFPADDGPLTIALGGLTVLPIVVGALLGGLWVGLAVGGLSALLDAYPGTALTALWVLVMPALLAGLAAYLGQRFTRRYGAVSALLITGAASSLTFWLSLGLADAFARESAPAFGSPLNLLLRTVTLALATLLVGYPWRRAPYKN
jgi:DNA-binding helix-hairpin-helix protein with protein kinase domain